MIWERLIALQIEANHNVNLLSSRQQNGFRFTGTTRQLLKEIAANHFTIEEENSLLQFTVDAVLSSLYQINQYYYFDEPAKDKLLLVYRQLLRDIKQASPDDAVHDHLAEIHYLRLQHWLVQNQSDAALLYPAYLPVIEKPVVCAEYSVKTQLTTLGIDEKTLMNPVLDIGCGKEHHLVSHLKNLGYDVYGIDREVMPGKHLLKESWLHFSYTPSYWGTIISHLGFTNHFRHHHLRPTGWHLQYAATFIQILKSLKVGGCFYYTPDLPFIEAFLNPLEYAIQKKQVSHIQFYSACIKRLV